MVNETAVKQGCTTYFTDSARNISGREVGATVGVCEERGGCATKLVFPFMW